MASEASEVPEWTILYHQPGKMKGRAEFLRLMLEDKGVPYMASDANMYGPNGMFCCFRGSPEAVQKDLDSASFPILFPPAIWHRKDGEEDVLINQTAACMVYLGDELGYAPPSAAERARANAVLLNCMDYIGEGRLSFHPVKNTMSYFNQKKEADIASKEFSQTRMKNFLFHFEKVVRGGKSTTPAPVAGGENVTYADFALFHVLDATVAQFNTDFYDHAWDKLEVPHLKEYYEWMKSRPNLQPYFQSDRCPPFAGDSMM